LSKGAMLTNKNLVANCFQFHAMVDPFFPAKQKHIAICALPLYHIYAFLVNGVGIFSKGHPNILVPNGRDEEALVKVFRKHKITFFPGVNTLFEKLLNCEDFCKIKKYHLLGTTGAGMAVLKST